MIRDGIPKQVRFRTDPEQGLGYRYNSIESARIALEAGSKTDTIVHSCELVSQLSKILPEILEEMPPEHAEEIATKV